MDKEQKKTVGFRVLYAAAIGVWLLLTSIAFTYVVRDSIAEVEAEFRAQAARSSAELRDKLKASEAVLAGFASLLAAVDGGDRDSVRHFASSMLASYPHIHMLEVARSVGERDRTRFERQQRAQWNAGFRIRNFTSGRADDEIAASEKATYRPIVFVWPEYDEALPLLGLDLDSVPYLRKALADSELRKVAISSPPFRLEDGSIAYVMSRPVGRSAAQAAALPANSFAGPLSAIALIKANALLPSSIAPHTAQRLEIARDGAGLEPALYEIVPSLTASALERRLFPALKLQTGDYGSSQPMQLSLERQIRFSDLSVAGLKLMTLLSLLMLTLLAAYLRHHHHELALVRALEAQSEYLSMHDPLTGLPNRNLLEDRVRQALAAWRRHGQGFALLFLDLDRFKAVNDDHGHEAGDRLLAAISHRLAGAVRESDTVARYGGDEFVVLVSESADEADLIAVADKISEAVARPVDIGRAVLTITTSLGISRCPQDGDDFDTLLNRADAAMYEFKRAGGSDAAPEPRPRIRLVG